MRRHSGGGLPPSPYVANADEASASYVETRGEGVTAETTVPSGSEIRDPERADERGDGERGGTDGVEPLHQTSTGSSSARQFSPGFLQHATENISLAIDSASRTLSGILDLRAMSAAEARELDQGTRDAMKMLRHASMIVQMENEDFIEEHAGYMESEDEKYPYVEGGTEEKETREAEDGEGDVAGAKYLPGKDAYAGLWPTFASRFWLDSVLLILLGAFLGLACIGYQYAITSGPRAYLTVDNPGYPLTNVGWGEGQLWWIGIGAGTGLVVGLVREVLNLRGYLGFVALIQMQDAGVVQSLKVIFCSILSLVGSASVGPEAGFSAIGGGAAALYYKYVLRFDKKATPTRYKYFILGGMAASFSGFLPAPLLGMLLVWELGLPPMAFGLNQVHFLSLLVMAACPAGAVFFSLGRKATSFNPVILNIPGVAEYNPPNYMFAIGILYGIMGALLGVYYVCVQLLVKAAFHPVKRMAKRMVGERAGRVLVAVIGGTLYGVLGWVLPLTMGDGSFQLVAPITYASSMDTGVLAASCFVNIICFWISVETGFVGGIFTPLLYSGSLLGAVFANITKVNTQVAVSCSFVALAASLIPAPITLCFFAASIFRLGSQYLFPLMTCCFTSHILFDGTGIARHLTSVLRARRLRGTIRRRKPRTIKFIDGSHEQQPTEHPTYVNK